MKNSSLTLVRIAAVAMLCVFSLAASSMAATHPLNYPYGLAVDAKGNLYVANTNGNQVLVYSPAHVQLTTKTITENINTPNAVAIDPNGNLWVGNGGSPASITEYTPGGAQITTGTITSGITEPNTIAFDGLANLWVQDAFSNVVVYPQYQTLPLESIPTGNAVTGISFHQGIFLVGSNFGTFIGETSYLLSNQGSTQQIQPTCYAMAWDNKNHVYCGNEDHTLVVMDPTLQPQTLAQLGFFPTGLAVDSSRGLIYVANGPGNQIAVYSTAGTLLTTIK